MRQLYIHLCQLPAQFFNVIVKNDSLHADIQGRLNIGRHIIDENTFFCENAELFQGTSVNFRLRFYESVESADAQIVKILMSRNPIPVVREVFGCV